MVPFPKRYRAVVGAARRISAKSHKDEAEFYADVQTLVDAVIDVHTYLWSQNPFKKEV